MPGRVSEATATGSVSGTGRRTTRRERPCRRAIPRRPQAQARASAAARRFRQLRRSALSASILSGSSGLSLWPCAAKRGSRSGWTSAAPRTPRSCCRRARSPGPLSERRSTRTGTRARRERLLREHDPERARRLRRFSRSVKKEGSEPSPGTSAISHSSRHAGNFPPARPAGRRSRAASAGTRPSGPRAYAAPSRGQRELLPGGFHRWESTGPRHGVRQPDNLRWRPDLRGRPLPRRVLRPAPSRHGVRGAAAQVARARPRHLSRGAAALPLRRKACLDLGWALGDVCFLLAPRVKEAIGMDASPRALELAEAARERRGLETSGSSRGTWRISRGVPEASIDVAGAFDLLEHVDDDTVRRMLRSLARVLKPGGVRRLHAQPRALRGKVQGARVPAEAVPGAHRGPAAPRDPAAARGGGLAGPLAAVLPGALSRRALDREAAVAAAGPGMPLPLPDPARGGAAAPRSSDKLTVSMRACVVIPCRNADNTVRTRSVGFRRRSRPPRSSSWTTRRPTARPRRRAAGARVIRNAAAATPGARGTPGWRRPRRARWLPRRRRDRAPRLARPGAHRASRRIPRSWRSAAASSTAARAGGESSTGS